MANDATPDASVNDVALLGLVLSRHASWVHYHIQPSAQIEAVYQSRLAEYSREAQEHPVFQKSLRAYTEASFAAPSSADLAFLLNLERLARLRHPSPQIVMNVVSGNGTVRLEVARDPSGLNTMFKKSPDALFEIATDMRKTAYTAAMNAFDPNQREIIEVNRFMDVFCETVSQGGVLRAGFVPSK